jgi:hypothetical protein
MADMAKKAPKSASETTEAPQGDKHANPRVAFYPPQWLLDVIDREAEENGRTRTSEMIRALKDYYQRLGKLP